MSANLPVTHVQQGSSFIVAYTLRNNSDVNPREICRIFSRQSARILGITEMPKIFRLTAFQHRQIDFRTVHYTADLYHHRVSLHVEWTCRNPDTRLKPGDLVSPRWSGKTTSQNGVIRLSRLVLLEQPESTLNLFHTVPRGWVKDRDLIEEAAGLWSAIPKHYAYLFNAIFWNGQRFRRFCMGPSSINDHHSMDNGNLIHSVDVAKSNLEDCIRQGKGNRGLSIVIGLLHDAGKADEYRLKPNTSWRLSDRGILIGHRQTIIEWIAAARARWVTKMPENQYQALVHCLTCSANAPAWVGARKPMMIEAYYLLSNDLLSGRSEMFSHGIPEEGGWGPYFKNMQIKSFWLEGNAEDPSKVSHG